MQNEQISAGAGVLAGGIGAGFCARFCARDYNRPYATRVHRIAVVGASLTGGFAAAMVIGIPTYWVAQELLRWRRSN
jgi:hypothetical protein